MSKYEQRDNTGSLFKNEKKEKDTHPDYRGECLIDGVAYYMDTWMKTADSGRKWMSFSFKPKQAQPAPPPQRQKDEAYRARQPAKADDFSDDVPF